MKIEKQKIDRLKHECDLMAEIIHIICDCPILEQHGKDVIISIDIEQIARIEDICKQVGLPSPIKHNK